MIHSIMTKVGFKNKTHEVYLYVGSIDVKIIFSVCQVNDYMVAVKENTITNKVLVQKHHHKPLKPTGQLILYNILNITQDRHFIKIYYISLSQPRK